MERTAGRRLQLAAVLVACAGWACEGLAEELTIQSFSGAGRLVFNRLNSATNYRIECATSPTGPWANTWQGLVPLPDDQVGSVTCSVPVFYRVVAAVTNGWLTLDTVGDLEFGTVSVGSTATREMTLLNRGGGPLTVTGIECTDGFSCGWTGVIPAGYQQTVIVTFAPQSDAVFDGTLTIRSDAGGGTFAMAVRGRGASDYLVIDLSDGSLASDYPVNYLQAQPGGGWTDEYKTTKLVLRRLPAAADGYSMGSPSGELGRQTNENRHTVMLTKSYYVGVFEVTQRQWERVTGLWPSYFTNEVYRDTRPVERVSYSSIRGSSAGAGWPANNGVDAASFLGLVRAKTGLTFDLPTEAQWEYACRAGTATALNSGYNLTSTGSDARMTEVGRYLYNGGSGSTPSDSTSKGTNRVGSYLPNAWGLYDMHGNVWEWCLDWYALYPGTAIDPAGPFSGANRVLHGGSWQRDAATCRSARRAYNTTSSLNVDFGFRLALTLDQP